MVCKRSLYCWKNGPCASDQTRKQIWEDNIRFRESLRDINQSDHYWSFQIYKNRCLCLEGEDMIYERPLSRKFRSASLQQLHVTDCASITHDCNGLKFRNCFVHCPIHNFIKSTESKRTDTPVPQSLVKKENALSYGKHPFNSTQKSDEKSEYCHRYKNTLNSRLKPSMKTKFLSQSNLTALNEGRNVMEKRILHGSCDNIQNVKEDKSVMKKTEKLCRDKKEINEVQPDVGDNTQITTNKSVDCQVQTDLAKTKKRRELKPIIKFPNKENHQEFSPISRTTRKMLCENKKIPFVTYGCNNSNLDIGSKRTHNVLASKLEVYPNALSAKQQKKNYLMKYIQSEKEFQRKCLPDGLRKINHSSLWSVDNNKEIKSPQKKSNKYILPVMSKPPKKLSVPSSQVDFANRIKKENPHGVAFKAISIKWNLLRLPGEKLQKVNCTPKNRRSGIGEEFSLYNLHREASPNFRSGQDVLEVGWGDSPEPLKIEKKFEPNRTPLNCKKKLETKESPKSSIPFKRRNVQSSFKISKSVIDISKYVAEVQELSKSVMKELNNDGYDKDLFEDEIVVSRNCLIEDNFSSKLLPNVKSSTEGANESKKSSNNGQNKDHMFDSILESFINEEDDWLSQALTSQEQLETPHKGKFVKSKSENKLTIPQSTELEKSCIAQNGRNINNNFQRSTSFDLTKSESCVNKSKNINSNASNNQYSLQEIERKRLEAKYRKERREIERKKLEAMKKLEMKKLRVIKT